MVAMKSKKLVSQSAIVYQLPHRMVIPVIHRDLDETLETVQGKEKSVKSLYEQYVMGTLDMKDLGGGNYDADGSDDIDPLNQFGLTFEEASQIEDAARNAAREIKQRADIADHPIESSKPEEKEKPREGGEAD